MAQNQCIFEYCNFGNGYLRLYFPGKKNTPAKEMMIDLEDYSVVNGVIENVEPLVEKIKSDMKDLGINSISAPLLLLRCAETYKKILFLPVKSAWQAKNLYTKEMKMDPDKDNYYTVNNAYKAGAGYIFNTYYMAQNVVEFFIKMAKMLGTDISEVQPYGMYLAETLEYNSNYVYFHIRNRVCTMILVCNQEFITTYDFEFESSRDIVQKFLLVVSKHEYEYAKQNITHFGIDADEPIDLDLGIELLESPKSK